MTSTASTSQFSPYQLKVLDLMSQVRDEQQMIEISDLLSNYFAQKAIDAADKLWEEGKINDSSIVEWKHEHMRTNYQKWNIM